MITATVPSLRVVVRILPLVALTAFVAGSLGFLGVAILGPVMPDQDATAFAAADQDAPEVAIAESAQFVADALVAKPLFSPTRTPPAPPQAPAVETPVAFVPPPAPEDPPPNYTVRGIVATPLTRKVLVRKEDQSKPIWLAEGDQSPEGWMLLRVGPDNVVFSKGSREIAVRLKTRRAQKSQFAIR